MIRARRSFRPGDEAAPLWMISFSDMQAQLVVFFAMLFAVAEVDDDRIKEFGASFTGSIGREGAPQREDFIDWWLASRKLPVYNGKEVIPERWREEGREFMVQKVKEGLRISLERAVTFEENSAEIRPEQVDAIAAFLRFTRGSLNRLDVRGFTSPNENPPDGDHWKLSYQRAKAVADLLVAGAPGEPGIDSARVRITGMGRNDPIVDVVAVRDLFQHQRNRRVEIIVLEEKVKVR